MRIEGVLFWVFPHRGECEFREKNILGKSCTTFVIVKIVRNLSRGRSPCQRVNHVKSGVIYFSAFIYSCIRYYSYVEPGPNTKHVDNLRHISPIFRSILYAQESNMNASQH